LVKKEPWAQENPQHDELKEIIAPIAAKYRQTQKELTEAKTTMRSFAEEVKQAERKQAAAASARNAAHQTSSHSQTSLAAQEAKPSQEVYTNSARETGEDIIFTPDLGNVDRRRYDIGTIEYHEDGTYTLTDMTGRRYDYPTPAPPKGDSCTVS
jgi:thiamine pyrophosphate-dependent acetolactate synthase large subunit-like protein